MLRELRNSSAKAAIRRVRYFSGQLGKGSDMGSYVEAHLLQGEQVLYKATRSPVAAYGPSIVLALAAVILGAVSHLVGMFLIFGVLAGVAALGGFLQIKSSEYALTDRRVIVKQGLIVRRSAEMLLGKVEGLSVDQNIFGRIFGYGSVTVNGTGGGRDPFKGIDKPFELRSAVQHQLEAVNSSAQPTA